MDQEIGLLPIVQGRFDDYVKVFGYFYGEEGGLSTDIILIKKGSSELVNSLTTANG